MRKMVWKKALLYFILNFFLSNLTAVNCILSPIAARIPLPGTPSPPGTPWPYPKEWEQSDELVVLSPDWGYVTSSPCFLLKRAFERYGRGFISHDFVLHTKENHRILNEILVTIEDETTCGEDIYPQLSNDTNYESYTLKIFNSSDINFAEATIEAKTIWGALRGIDTFSQLLWFNQTEAYLKNFVLYANLTTIEDSPRYPHRGLMIDTARHYVPKEGIFQVLEGLSYNKLNVLHWHIVDDQSFPFVSRKFPELANKGAYFPNLDEDLYKYSPKTVREVFDFARDRGIRVILEFDTPGHTWGFAKAWPQLITPCYGEGEEGGPGIGIPGVHAAYEIFDPSNEEVYTKMREFFEEIIDEVSVDRYVHLGMDEVYYACWNSSPVIKEFMRNHSYTELSQVQQHYTEKLLQIIKDLGGKSVVWNDPLDYGVKLEEDVIVQVWKGQTEWQSYFQAALDTNAQVLLSSCWYLNYIAYGHKWRDYFQCDPVLGLPTIKEDQKKQILGGEAALWAEWIDGNNAIQRIFPFISAVAERLWSPMPEFLNDTNTDDAMWRLEEHRCRFIWRGIPAQPVFNGYCGFWDTDFPVKKFEEKEEITEIPISSTEKLISSTETTISSTEDLISSTESISSTLSFSSALLLLIIAFKILI